MSDARLYYANAWHAIVSDHGEMMNAVKHRDCLGVPPPQMQAGSGFTLQVLAALVPQAAVGFPLQSVTRSSCPVSSRSFRSYVDAQSLTALSSMET